MMHMSFWTGYDYQNFFFSSIDLTSPGGLIAAGFVFLIAVALSELAKLSLATLKLEVARNNCKQARELYSSDSALLPKRPSHVRTGWISLIVVSLYFVETILGYTLMLAVMTYNLYLFLFIIIGSALFYFLTGQHTDYIRLERSRLKYECSHCTKSRPEGSNASNETDSSDAGTPGPSLPDVGTHVCCSSREMIEESVRV